MEPKALVKTILDGKSISLSLYSIEILSEPEQYEFIINQEGGEKQNFAFCVQQKKQCIVEWILGLEHKIDANWNGLLKVRVKSMKDEHLWEGARGGAVS